MKTIEQYIETEMSNLIIRKRNSPIGTLLVLIVGIGALVLLRTVTMSDSLSATCLSVGLIATVLGLILMGMNLTGALSHYVYLPTQSRMRGKIVYVSNGDYPYLVEALTEGNMKPLSTLRSVVSSNSVIRFFTSTDGKCMLVQALRDQSGHLEPDTEVRYLSGGSAAELIHLTK